MTLSWVPRPKTRLDIRKALGRDGELAGEYVTFSPHGKCLLNLGNPSSRKHSPPCAVP